MSYASNVHPHPPSVAHVRDCFQLAVWGEVQLAFDGTKSKSLFAVRLLGTGFYHAERSDISVQCQKLIFFSLASNPLGSRDDFIGPISTDH